MHVNLVKKTNVPGEEEYLFAPYSAFTVLSASWNAGTTADPHVIELQAAMVAAQLVTAFNPLGPALWSSPLAPLLPAALRAALPAAVPPLLRRRSEPPCCPSAPPCRTSARRWCRPSADDVHTPCPCTIIHPHFY